MLRKCSSPYDSITFPGKVFLLQIHQEGSDIFHERSFMTTYILMQTIQDMFEFRMLWNVKYVMNTTNNNVET
jgi:hypothetical protein